MDGSAKALEASSELQVTAAAAKLRILVVNSDARARLQARSLLEGQGYLIAEAQGGADGMRRARDWLPHLILLDADLPDLDSRELCRRIKSAPGLGDSLVVMIAAGPTAGDERAAGLEAGADSFLMGPLGDRELLAWVHALVRILRLDRPTKADPVAFSERESMLQLAQRAASLGHYVFYVEEDFWVGSEVLDEIFGIGPEHPRTVAGWMALIHPEDREELGDYLRQRVLGAREPFDRHYRIRRPGDGQERWVHGHGVLATGPDGMPQRLVGVIRDITEQRRAEADIFKLNRDLERRVRERTAALEAVNAELESFAFSVSHDLRAPLRAICGFAQILSRRYRDCLDAEGRHYLDQVVAAGGRMSDLIQALLAYARAGGDAVRAVPVPLQPLMAELAFTFGERLCVCAGTLDQEEPLAVPLGDPILIRQILGNLVENALMYRCPDTPPRIRISAERAGAETIVRVTDNGIGIALEDQARIFQVFQRLHEDDAYPGNGIGLAIVAKAARMMGGGVEVSSEPGRGSTFSVRLPAAPLADRA